MKKILLLFSLFSIVTVGKSQTVINEVYVEPGSGKSEFFELYNSSPVGSENMDCYTMLAYWESGANKGWYVIDFPNLSVGPKSYFTGAAATPFSVQIQTGVVANFSWNDAVFLAANNGFLRSYQQNGATYNAPTTPANLQDMFYKASFNGPVYTILLFKNGAFVNGLRGGGSSGALNAQITAMPNLSIDMAGACADFVVNFAALPVMEFVNQAPGSDNGFARTSDGRCGAWEKTAPGISHTPGVTNGNATGLTGSLTTVEAIQCGTNPRSAIVDVTAISGDVTLAADFPVEARVYQDFNNNQLFDGPDVFIGSTLINDVASSSVLVPLTPSNLYQNSNLIIVYATKRGCFDVIRAVANTCIPLPVDFKSFTATRNRTNVMLKWETATEINNYGFALERNVNGSWQEIAFVPSQATNGNSDQVLVYTYNDLNNAKGISQYRIKQVDFDGKNKFSDIRSVRGEGQGGKLTVFPNPTQDGRINVVFEDANVTRDIALIDMSGRVVKQVRNISNNNITLDNLVSGMYTLRVVVPATGEQTVQKVVVNKK